MIKSGIFCDVCDTEKKKTNNWLIATSQNEGVLTFHKWDNKLAHRKDVKHICGQNCSQTLLSKWQTQDAAYTVALKRDAERIADENNTSVQ